MSNKGFSHIGLSTLDLDMTRAFYEDVLDFKAVVADDFQIQEGGRLRHVFFHVGRDQLLAFIEARDVPGVPAHFDAGINRGLGVPAAFYHFAFEAGSEAALADRRDRLRVKGIEVSDITDHGWAKSIYFRDPNGLSLEYCCIVRDLREEDARMQERGTIPLAALHYDYEEIANVSRMQAAPIRESTAPAAR
jgi:catechol 2,3-dioxygenase-like lactoylglutathione lyase family enzyme